MAIRAFDLFEVLAYLAFSDILHSAGEPNFPVTKKSFVLGHCCSKYGPQAGSSLQSWFIQPIGVSKGLNIWQWGSGGSVNYWDSGSPIAISDATVPLMLNFWAHREPLLYMDPCDRLKPDPVCSVRQGVQSFTQCMGAVRSPGPGSPLTWSTCQKGRLSTTALGYTQCNSSHLGECPCR